MIRNKDRKSAGPPNLRRFLRESAFFLLDILYNAVIIIVLVILIRTFLISPFRVIGSSMADTLQSNEFILIDKLSYHLGTPQRGDAIVFRPPITNKYPYKFEETLTTDEKGEGKLDLEPLRTPKAVIYCHNNLTGLFWFCQDSVETGDFIFWLPKEDALKSKGEGAWKGAEERPVKEDEVKAGMLTLQGKPGQSYRLRIYGAEGPEYFVKRIIGIPSDTIKIENGRVYLKKKGEPSFKALDEFYLSEENKNQTYFSQPMATSEFEVPEGHYFVLGDNRNHSNDSRSWLSPIYQNPSPYVPLSNISGRVLVVLWPLSSVRLIRDIALE